MPRPWPHVCRLDLVADFPAFLSFLFFSFLPVDVDQWHPLSAAGFPVLLASKFRTHVDDMFDDMFVY